MSVHIHIERLILDGLPVTRSQAPLVQAAVESELARLVAQGGLAPDFSGGGAMPYVQAGAMQVTSSNDAAALGRQIAQSVYGGIGHG
jgi:hypothetical protein